MPDFPVQLAMMLRVRSIVVVAFLAVTAAGAQAQLRGHGGPVRALAISADGKRRSPAASTLRRSAGRWSANAAEQVLRFHDSAVNAVVLLPDGRAATAGEDGRIAIWKPGAATARKGARRPHGAGRRRSRCRRTARMLASASWDHTARVWPLGGGEPRVLEGHKQNVNGVAFTPDGKALVTAGYDATLRIWPLEWRRARRRLRCRRRSMPSRWRPTARSSLAGARRQGLFPSRRPAERHGEVAASDPIR